MAPLPTSSPPPLNLLLLQEPPAPLCIQEGHSDSDSLRQKGMALVFDAGPLASMTHASLGGTH